MHRDSKGTQIQKEPRFRMNSFLSSEATDSQSSNLRFSGNLLPDSDGIHSHADHQKEFIIIQIQKEFISRFRRDFLHFEGINLIPSLV